MRDDDIYAPCHVAGGMTAYEWERDPKRLAFILARYKFVARMLEGRALVLEVGCSDGFGSRIVRQHVGHLSAVDVDEDSIVEARAARSDKWPIEFFEHDLLEAPLPGYDAAYALDVLEHIEPGEEERRFLQNLRACAPVAVIGMPSLESQVHASKLSRLGHVNCKSGAELKRTLIEHWKHIFLFGMNDETLHTGFPPMCHYLLALAVA